MDHGGSHRHHRPGPVLLYYRQIYHAADAVNLSREQLSWPSAGNGDIHGPVVAIFIIMVGLMSVIGAPMAWMRLSVIGAAPTELTAATWAPTPWE